MGLRETVGEAWTAIPGRAPFSSPGGDRERPKLGLWIRPAVRYYDNFLSRTRLAGRTVAGRLCRIADCAISKRHRKLEGVRPAATGSARARRGSRARFWQAGGPGLARSRPSTRGRRVLTSSPAPAARPAASKFLAACRLENAGAPPP